MTRKRLLIEDDYDVAEMLVMYFTSHGYEVLHADTGQNGVNLARSHSPNLMLLDVMLPDIDGYEVCRRVRLNVFTKYIPVIFLTQRDERANKVRGLELGADDYITKPFDVEELRLRVQGSIHRATRESLHEARTGLPTGDLVDDEITRRSMLDEPYTTFTFTLSGFDAYSDVYGFMAASEVLAFAGQSIKEIVGQRGTPDDFVGIRGNQFVVLTCSVEARALEAEILQRFNSGVKAFYSFNDVERGGLVLYSGTEREEFVPLMSLSQC